MAVHKPEPLFVPPPLSELPSPGIGFLSSLRAKSKDLSIGTLTPACILIMSPSACAENKLDGYCVILASSLWINALGETWFYGVPTRDPLAFPCRSLRVSPSIASRRRGRGGFFGTGGRKQCPAGHRSWNCFLEGSISRWERSRGTAMNREATLVREETR